MMQPWNNYRLLDVITGSLYIKIHVIYINLRGLQFDVIFELLPNRVQQCYVWQGTIDILLAVSVSCRTVSKYSLR